MTRRWFQVAKSEFLIQTSRFHRKRKIVLPAAFVFAIAWATYISPSVMSLLIGNNPQIDVLLMAIFPGLMRSAIWFMWLWLLFYPISSALREIKIGQWEILLSHDVRTRSIILGTFVSKIPVYGLLTLILSSLLVAPFTIVFQVGFVGQLVMYLAIFFFVISTLWLSDFLSTAIQAKLGDSPRGNDLAKALSVVMAVIFVVPIYVLIFFAGALSQVLGLNVFLLFPFTWGADLISWTVISFNGVGLSQPVINGFQNFLQLSWPLDLLLFSAFSLFIVGLSFASAGRLFRVGAGPRTEKVITAGKDGPFMRLIRRVSPGPSGILLTGTLKDFMRKAQNLSRLALAVLFAIMFPLFLNSGVPALSAANPTVVLWIMTTIPGYLMALVGGATFGGIGFLDSKDELWIIQTPPSGASKFVKARIKEAALMTIIVATVASLSLFFLLNYFTLADIIVVWLYAFASMFFAAIAGIGISANNPMYDDTQSAAFRSNQLVSGGIVLATNYPGWWLVAAILFHPWQYGFPVAMLITIAPLLLAGILSVYIGTKRLGRPMR
jgi:hypothetical protein